MSKSIEERNHTSGMRLCIEILGELRKGRATHMQIAERLGVDRDAVRNRLFHMVEDGMVHVASWQPAATKGRPIPVFAFGEGESAPAPNGKPSVNRVARYASSRAGFRSLWEALGEPVTRLQIGAETGINNGGLRALLAMLHERRLIHVAGWARKPGVQNGPWSAQFMRGNEPDTPKPERMPQIESCRKYQRRLAAAKVASRSGMAGIAVHLTGGDTRAVARAERLAA